MNRKVVKRMFALILAAIVTVSAAACGSGGDAEGSENPHGKEAEEGETTFGVELPKGSNIDVSVGFKEAHDAFATTLAREENDDDPIPEPPGI